MSDTTPNPVILPLIPSRPRLRFMTEAAPGAAEQTQTQNGTTQTATTQGQQAQQQEPPKPPWGDDPSKFDPDKAWKLIQNIKGDLEAERTKREEAVAAAVAEAAEKAQKETLAQFGRLLAGEEPVETDPVKLQEKVTTLAGQVKEKDGALTQAQADLKARDLALAVALQAPGLGGNTKLLLANDKFKTSIASVDPADEAAITAAITQALQENAALKAPPSRSGSGEHTGATVESLEQQLAAATKEGNWRESMRLKRAIAEAKKRSGA